MKKRISILGSTGSIGTNTLDVLARHADAFEVFALSAHRQVDLMLEQCVSVKPSFAVMVDPQAAKALEEKIKHTGVPTRVLSGKEALDTIASHPDVDMVMAAIVGAAGLSSCLSAARAGKRLLLANKEALVVGAEVFTSTLKAHGATLLPIDSEHSAIFQSLPDDPSTWSANVAKIILTASGGPFRTLDPNRLKAVTVQEACAHPTWVMGRKISVDSATMMNKALEVIEAHYLFGVKPEQLKVVIHPQSVIHSMVEYVDASVVAQLGTPDMRVPIAYGLSWPKRIASGAKPIDFSSIAPMTFESFDDPLHQRRYPGLQLAWQVLNAPKGSTAVLNAANEIAVAAFLEERIRFDQIHALNVQTLSAFAPSVPQGLEDLLEIDRRARQVASEMIKTLH
ncbi:MAG: 1-deoxy-D-xylulose-5-phosphate reductoisomerase [Betaproteobacteria bacterium]|jgi:1-deoxy-D-xylulose-5-phosphate reductoisomerase